MASDQGESQYRFFWIAIVSAVVLLTIAVFVLFSSGDYVFFQTIFSLIFGLWWLILPIPIWLIFKLVWGEYSELNWMIKQNFIILEIVPPTEIEKSPKLMEQVFASLHDYSTSNLFEIYCGWRPLQVKFSFEIVSTEGNIHYYIKCPQERRNFFESKIYSQYPDVEIFEAEDYTTKVPANLPNKDWHVWGSTMALVDKDELPIRTYKHFVEDVTGKMIDPLGSLFESWGTLGKDQHAWAQFILTPEKEPYWHPKSLEFLDELMGKPAPEKKQSQFAKLFKGLLVIPGNILRGLFGMEMATPSAEENAEEEFNFMRLPLPTQEKVKAVHENISKPGYWTTIRFVYTGKNEGMDKPAAVGGFMGAIKQLADVNLNSLYPDPKTKTFANYYFTEARMNYRRRKNIADYRGRSFQGMVMLLNTEELATVCHFPDMSVVTPTMKRVETKKGDAPVDLPVGLELED